MDTENSSKWLTDRFTDVSGDGTPLPVADLGPADYDRVMDLARKVNFLPKNGWRSTHAAMIRDGLDRGIWHGIGVMAPEDGALLSYLDYRMMPDGAVRVGFCMTDPSERGRGHMQRLINTLVRRHFDRAMDVSSHERNGAMLKILARHGFTETRRVAGERINGEASVYLDRAPHQPIVP